MKKRFIAALALSVAAVTTLVFAAATSSQQITVNHNGLVYELNKTTEMDTIDFSLETASEAGDYEIAPEGLKFFEDPDLTKEVDAAYDEKTGEFQIQKGLDQVFVKLPVAFALSTIEETSFAPTVDETVKYEDQNWFTVSTVSFQKTSEDGSGQLLVGVKAANREIAPRLPVLKTAEGNIPGASDLRFDQDYYFTEGYFTFSVGPDFSLGDIRSMSFENILTRTGSETVAVPLS